MKWISFLPLIILVAVPGPVGAEDDPPADAPANPPLFTEPDVDPVVEEVGKEAAKELISALAAAEETRDETEIIAAIEPMITAGNELFVKPLEKLAKNRLENIREVATMALGSQGPGKKVGPKVYAILMSRGNKKSHAVIAAAIHSLRRLGYDKKQVYDECESLFQKRPDLAVMRACARYFGDMKKKESLRHLIYWVEPPAPANVNSPTNPPASYWQRMHEIWMGVKLTVLAALKNITGQEFETHAEWRDWLKTPEARKLGLR